MEMPKEDGLQGRKFIGLGFTVGALLALMACGVTDNDNDTTPPDPDPEDSVPVVVVPDSTNGWLYGYDSLLADLGRWRQSPFVKVDSIGASVEGRALWMVTITGEGDSLGASGDSSDRKRRVVIHARTHPSEVQAGHIAGEMVKFLLDSSSESAAIRAGYIFHLIPMYNPDGVEKGPGRSHGYARLNANQVDLEGGWDDTPAQPEVAALRAKFQEFMQGPLPIEVALNLHSDRFNCTRFFFYHAAAGTSAAYAEAEKDFIADVRAHFPEGIEEWSFVQSWTTGTPPQYPESFWWLNHQEQVMALTYEDANCPGASEFDRTARALVSGSVDYLDGKPAAGAAMVAGPVPSGL